MPSNRRWQRPVVKQVPMPQDPQGSEALQRVASRPMVGRFPSDFGRSGPSRADRAPARSAAVFAGRERRALLSRVEPEKGSVL
jgi:hypothetical protein